MFRLIARDFFGFVLLAVGALALGAIINQGREKPLPLRYASKSDRLTQAVSETAHLAPLPAAQAVDIREISLEEFRDLAAEKSAVVVDARPELFYRLGHIPGALVLPCEEFAGYFEKHRSRLADKKRVPVLIYCGGDPCVDSALVAKALSQLGYLNLSIFTGGWSQWQQAGLPEERS